MPLATQMQPVDLAGQFNAPMHDRLVARQWWRCDTLRSKFRAAALGQKTVPVTSQQAVLRRQTHQKFDRTAGFIGGRKRPRQLPRHQDSRKIRRAMPDLFVRIIPRNAAERIQ